MNCNHYTSRVDTEDIKQLLVVNHQSGSRDISCEGQPIDKVCDVPWQENLSTECPANHAQGFPSTMTARFTQVWSRIYEQLTGCRTVQQLARWHFKRCQANSSNKAMLPSTQMKLSWSTPRLMGAILVCRLAIFTSNRALFVLVPTCVLVIVYIIDE